DRQERKHLDITAVEIGSGAILRAADLVAGDRRERLGGAGQRISLRPGAAGALKYDDAAEAEVSAGVRGEGDVTADVDGTAELGATVDRRGGGQTRGCGVRAVAVACQGEDGAACSVSAGRRDQE